jgi:hypothetical protein
MKLTLWTKCIVLLAAGTLAACGGNAPVPAGTSSSAAQPSASHKHKLTDAMVAMTTALHIVPTIHRNARKSWMTPLAKHTQYLLYVSDEAAGSVDVYAYRSRKGHLVGQLTGFQFPYGECQDGTGNVYVTDFAAEVIVEYAHGATSPIKTLDDSYGYPIGCSVNPVTGDLAVANWESNDPSDCAGSVVVYADAEGSGTNYTNANFMYLYPPAYDPSGNLYAQGQSSYPSSGSGLVELPSGGSSLETIPLSGGTIYFPGGLQWVKTYLAATDQAYNGGTTSGIYQITVNASEASIGSSIELTDQCYKGSTAYNDVVQPWINGTARPFHAVVAGNLACDYRYNNWSYVHGGDPRRSMPGQTAPMLASGQTVSAMKQGQK